MLVVQTGGEQKILESVLAARVVLVQSVAWAEWIPALAERLVRLLLPQSCAAA